MLKILDNVEYFIVLSTFPNLIRKCYKSTRLNRSVFSL